MAGKDQNKEDRPVSDWPNMDPRWWMLAAVTVFGFAIIGAAVAAVEVFSRVLPTEAEKLVTVLTPFGTIILAVVTFLTVVWRGLLTDQQVKEQRRQNNAKDDEMLAKLLVDGVGLVESDGNGKRLAGISVLQTVATAPSDRYAGNAMDIMLTFFEQQSSSDDASRARVNVHEALAKAAKMGRRANTGIWLNDSHTPFHQPPPGAQFIGLSGGQVGKETFAGLDRQTKWYFSNVQFEDCSIEDGPWLFNRCQFLNCWLERPPLFFSLRNVFAVCDFSGSSIDSDQFMAYVENCGSLKSNDNYCSNDNLPICDRLIDWSDELHCLDGDGYPVKPR